MLEFIKFASGAIGSAILVGGMLSLVVHALIRTSQKATKSDGSQSERAGYSEQPKSLLTRRPAEDDEQRQRKKGVALSPAHP